LLVRLGLVLGLDLLEVREGVLQALVVRVDGEERLETADRVVEPGQALAGREVDPIRGRLALLAGLGRGGGRPRGTARLRGPRGDDQDGLVRASRRSQGRVRRRERSDRDHEDDRDDRVPPGLPHIRVSSPHMEGIDEWARGT
jgi:hypothetical protein